MKRFTLLTMLMALFGVMSFAQKAPSPWQGMVTSPSTAIKGIARMAQPTTNMPKRAADQVAPPATATVETWYTTEGTFYVYGRYGWEDYTANVPTINVAVDGSDFYIQGLSYYFAETWIKGSLDGSTVVFDNPQLAGMQGDAFDYLVGGDRTGNVTDNIVFNYDADGGLLTAVTAILAESPTAESIESVYTYWVLPVFSKEKPKGPEPVVAPEGLVTDEWAINAMTNFGDPVSGYLNIGFDGNDVYLQGFCTYLPETWIKGTLNGNTITFPGDQYFGGYDADYYTHYEFFLLSDGVVFTYDAEAGKMTATGEIYIREAIRNYKGDVYNDPVLTKVVEKAGTPSIPNISQIYDGTDGPIAMYTVPTTDVNGNAMASAKLTFQFLKDVEQDISPVTFDPADYACLTEPMTEIAYGYSNTDDFHPKHIILRQADYKTWNKIGIQTIYAGGGEVNKSEIFWLDLKPYEKATFDFNAMKDEPCSNVGHEGDITEDRTFTANNVTLTVSPSTTNTPNRFWSTSNGPQLRVYGGTLTFEAPVGKVIKRMVFNNGKWNDGNSADSGQFDGNVWTGEAKKVVVTIAANTQLNSIDVYPTDYVPTAVTAPENLVTDTYIFRANSLKPYYDPAELTLWVKVGFDGNDAYIQGLAADYNSSVSQLWVKATKNEAGQYVIPANQFMGSVSFWMSTIDCYFTAVDENGNMVDAVLDFDAEKAQFTTTQSLVLNAMLTELYPYETFTDVTITKFDEVAATPADPDIISISFGEWSHYITCNIPNVGSNGETLNPQKLFYTVWIEKNGETAPYTFTAEMYSAFDEDITELPWDANYYSWDNSHSIYFYDEAEVFSEWTKVGIQSIYYGAGEVRKSNIDWIGNPELGTGISDIAVGQQAAKTVYFNLSGQRLHAPRKGLNIVNGRVVMVK
ncbi:MAG: hypothetical protein K6B13_01870 [Prevotella sp.]|nr:hypothetical protein [Prevotella sp.]